MACKFCHVFFILTSSLLIGTFDLTYGNSGSFSKILRDVKFYGLTFVARTLRWSRLRWIWGRSGGQFYNKIDHTIYNRKFWPTDDQFLHGIGPLPPSAKFRFSRQEEKVAKMMKSSPRTRISFSYSPWKDTVIDNIEEEYDRCVHHLHRRRTFTMKLGRPRDF